MASTATFGGLHGRSYMPAHLAEHEDDEHGNQMGYIKGTDYSLPYLSQWSRLQVHDTGITKDLLRHINCGYLSTHGVAPTLLALKQHAQSLCVLIQALNPTLRAAEIVTSDPTTESKKGKKSAGLFPGTKDTINPQHERNSAFDFLWDLSVPYTNDDPNHNKPLNGLVNEVRGRNEAFGTDYHCPLAESAPRAKGEPVKPYANHHGLAMHANACLERLDHEFASTGGLISLLPIPDEGDREDDGLRKARGSLLGQWLLYTQHLVGRMHELERSYANSLDAIAGEAALPPQHLGAVGPDGRSTGREIVYPQDRWVLVNSGDDVFGLVHDLLDKQEELVQTRERTWRDNGAVGDILWREDHARGIVSVTVPTRYYRLMGRAGSGRRNAPVFVIPAWDHHPGVAYTKELEAQPTIVSSVQPRWPLRTTELEKKAEEAEKRAERAEKENRKLAPQIRRVEAEMRTLRAENQRLAKTRDQLLLRASKGEKATVKPTAKPTVTTSKRPQPTAKATATPTVPSTAKAAPGRPSTVRKRVRIEEEEPPVVTVKAAQYQPPSRKRARASREVTPPPRKMSTYGKRRAT